MSDIIQWPPLLMPRACSPSHVPFSRTGGRSLGGIERSVKTDRGFWRIGYEQVLVHTPVRRRIWDAVRTALNGRAGLIAIPVWSFGASAFREEIGFAYRPETVTHSDETALSDGTEYHQRQIAIDVAALAPVGATSIMLRPVDAGDDLTGIRFSYNYALYETGRVRSIVDDVWQLEVFPAIRRAIPEGAALECDRPMCLAHLASDAEMDLTQTWKGFDSHSISFVEATDYWSDLALAEAAA